MHTCICNVLCSYLCFKLPLHCNLCYDKPCIHKTSTDVSLNSLIEDLNMHQSVSNISEHFWAGFIFIAVLRSYHFTPSLSSKRRHIKLAGEHRLLISYLNINCPKSGAVRTSNQICQGFQSLLTRYIFSFHLNAI